MDWTWTSCFAGFWIFALLGLLFMAAMALACHALRPRCMSGCMREPPRSPAADQAR